jgi:hypothetical protein
MAAIFAFTCACCGKVHEGSPSFAFDAPLQYSSLSEEQKQSMGTLTSDLCTITHDDATDYFIRTILEIPIHGVAEPFTWGVWVSLSEKSFKRYVETYDDPVEGEGYFGWVCNRPRVYSHNTSIATDVLVQARGLRPKLHLHKGSANDAQIVIDQLKGISIARAQALAEEIHHGV